MEWRKRILQPYWNDVRAISNTTAVRLVILIPLIGYWILFNDRLIEWSKLIVDQHNPSANAISWRLFATYFGLCFVGAASFIYQCFCPREVKAFSDATEYLAATEQNISRIELNKLMAEIDGDNYNPHKTLDLKSVPLYLQQHYDIQNRLYPKWRRTVSVLYLLGAAILVVPSVDVFVRVFIVMFRQFGLFP